MADDSICKRVLAEVEARIARITPENGFATDAGRTIFMGAIPQLGQDDPDAAIAIVPDDQEWETLGEHFRCDWMIAIYAVVNAVTLGGSEGRSRPWMLAEDVLADIKRAMEPATDPRRRMGGLLTGTLRRGPTRHFERQSGSEVIAKGQSYEHPVTEVWGHPEVAR